jgi:hypothetical protein
LHIKTSYYGYKPIPKFYPKVDMCLEAFYNRLAK